MSTDSKQTETRVLLASAAGAFGAGLAGAIWHTKRKQAKEMAMEAAAAATQGSTAPVASSPSPLPTPSAPLNPPPKMTAAEYAAAKREARFFALKTLGYGTLLAFSGAGLLAVTVGWWLDVRSFREFSDKLQVIVPRQTARLRKFLGGSELVMRQEEEEELNRVMEQEE